MPSQALREQLAERCLTLLRIPSVTGDEQAITDHLHQWARSLPHVNPDDIHREGNALVIGAPDESRPCIALVGHTDTVPPQGADVKGPKATDTGAGATGSAAAPNSAAAAGSGATPNSAAATGSGTNPNSAAATGGDSGSASRSAVHAYQDGDRITGLGASDMKGSIAVMQLLYEKLDLENLPFALMLVLYDKEEGPFRDNGLQPLLDRLPFLRETDFAIAMEPTDNTLQLGCMGGIQAKLTFNGQAAHSARPWQGENAIHKAGPFLTSLLNRGYPEVNVEGLVFREAVSVTLAEGGRARNVVPDRFTLNVNFRFAPQGTVAQSTDAAVQELRRLAQGAEVEILDVAPPGPIPMQNPILEHMQALTDLPVQPKQAWTDVARLAAHGIDAVNFGPGMGAQAHQVGEWISLDAMLQAYEVLAHVLGTPLSVT